MLQTNDNMERDFSTLRSKDVEPTKRKQSFNYVHMLGTKYTKLS